MKRKKWKFAPQTSSSTATDHCRKVALSWTNSAGTSFFVSAIVVCLSYFTIFKERASQMKAV